MGEGSGLRIRSNQDVLPQPRQYLIHYQITHTILEELLLAA